METKIAESEIAKSIEDYLDGCSKQELIDLANSKDTVILAIDGDRGGEMLFSQLNDMMKITFVAQAPVGQEWELLPQKTVTKCLSMKEDSGKFAAKLTKKQKEEDEAAGFEDKDWAEELPEEFEVEEAPAEIQEYMDHR